MTQQTLTKDTLWYDPKSQRIVIIHEINTTSVFYRDIGTETVYMQPIEGFLSIFSCQKHSQH